jgi:hypothetical protein
MVNTSQNLNKSYGYLWWLNGKQSFMVPTLQTVFPAFMCPNAPADMISAIGSGGQFLNVVPSQNLVWLRMGDEPSNSNVPFLLNDDIWQYVNDLTCSTSGIEENGSSEKVNVFPNPACDLITVSVKKGTLGTAIIYDQLGTKIKEINSNNHSAKFTIADLQNGIYFISLPDRGISLRFVKNNE